MAIYPKQLQQFDGDTTFRKGRVNEVVLAAGTISGDKTVNDILSILELHFSRDINSETRTRPRFRRFDTSFGSTVVFTDAQVITEQAAGELIAILRVLWDIDRTVTNNSIGYATSVQN